MSNRRRRGRQPWVPWTAPARDHPVKERIHQSTTDNGRTRIDAFGADAGALACIDAFRKAGAKEVSFGYDPPDGLADVADVEDIPPGVEVTWWFRVDFGGGDVRHGRSKPTSDHARGVLEAAAEILRAGGGTVTFHTPGAN